MYRITMFTLTLCSLLLPAIVLSAPQTINIEEIGNFDGAESDESMGWSVAIDGDDMVVGAPQYSSSGYVAYLYLYDGKKLLKKVHLTPADPLHTEGFGRSVAISGSTVIVHSENSVYVFEKPVTGWTDMNETSILTISDASITKTQVWSMAISGDTIVICASNNDPLGIQSPVSAYIFTKSGSGWENSVQGAKLSAPGQLENYYFGNTVAINDNILVVGARVPGGEGIYGSAYLYIKPDNDTDSWVSTNNAQKLVPDLLNQSDWFGASVAIDKTSIAIGAMGGSSDGYKGAVFIFEPDSIGQDYVQKAMLTATHNEASDNFASEDSLSFSDETLVVGARWRHSNGLQYGGAVYLFKKPIVSEWLDATENMIILSSDMEEGDDFGTSVGISGDKIIVGAASANFWAGAAYVFSLSDKVYLLSPAIMMHLLN